MPLTRKSVLSGAEVCVCQDRNGTYGSPEDSFQAIANFWDTWLITRYRKREMIQIDALDVAEMMSLLKKARTAANPKHEDNFIDDVGYSCCAGEIASNMDEKG